jgi:hypothetical protein
MKLVNAAGTCIFILSKCVTSLPQPVADSRAVGDRIVQIPIDVFDEIRQIVADVRLLGYSYTPFFLNWPLDTNTLVDQKVITNDLKNLFDKNNPAAQRPKYSVNWDKFADPGLEKAFSGDSMPPRNQLEFEKQLQLQLYHYATQTLAETNLYAAPSQVEAAYNLAMDLKKTLGQKFMTTRITPQGAKDLWLKVMPQSRPGEPETFRDQQALKDAGVDWRFKGALFTFGDVVVAQPDWQDIVGSYLSERAAKRGNPELLLLTEGEAASVFAWEKMYAFELARMQGMKPDHYLLPEEYRGFVVQLQEHMLPKIGARLESLYDAGQFLGDNGNRPAVPAIVTENLPPGGAAAPLTGNTPMTPIGAIPDGFVGGQPGFGDPWRPNTLGQPPPVHPQGQLGVGPSRGGGVPLQVGGPAGPQAAPGWENFGGWDGGDVTPVSPQQPRPPPAPANPGPQPRPPVQPAAPGWDNFGGWDGGDVTSVSPQQPRPPPAQPRPPPAPVNPGSGAKPGPLHLPAGPGNPAGDVSPVSPSWNGPLGGDVSPLSPTSPRWPSNFGSLAPSPGPALPPPPGPPAEGSARKQWLKKLKKPSMFLKKEKPPGC